MSAVGDFSGSVTAGRPRLARAEGRSLAAVLAASGPMPARRVGHLIDGIALALQEAHRKGVAHGRLAPENVLLLPPAGGDGSEAIRTKLIGFAPAGAADPSEDQRALGAIAYELLTGVAPSSGVPRSIRERAPDVDFVVDEVVRRALCPDPDLRWADVYTFSTRLREAVEGLGLSDDPTRLAPIPLTVSRPSGTPTPVEIDVELPVIASVDVDMSTPAPRTHAPSPGGLTMNPNHHQPPRGPSPGGHYPIRPTPTFSFTDGPEPGPMWTPPGRQRRGRRGGFPLLVLMAVAGLGGYFAVRYHAWPELGPVTERAKDLVRALRTLAPSAKLDPPPPAAPAPAAAAANEPGAAPAAAPALHPEVVPIVSPTAAPPKPAPLSPARAHVSHARKRKPLKPLSAEAAEEEALLASPSR